MATKTKSVFLYGNPTKVKGERFQETQKAFTALVNFFINEMIQDETYTLDLLNNNPKSPRVRGLEKAKRHTHPLGSAYGQNAIDYAVKELHNHLIHIKNKLYGYVVRHEEHLKPYLQSIGLFHACIRDEDELETLQKLIQNERDKKKPKEETLQFYQDLLKTLLSFSEEERRQHREDVRMLYREKLENWKLPFVKKATVQLDTRVCSLEKSEDTTSDYVLQVKLLGSSKWIEMPVTGSRRGVRRLDQYKTGSPSFSLRNGKLKVTVPFKKKTRTYKPKTVIGLDAGITDLLYSSEGEQYGSFKGMDHFYNEKVQPKLHMRSNLRNKMRSYQKELHRDGVTEERETVLREKIHHMASMLNGQKKVSKCRRVYAHEVNRRLNKAVNGVMKTVQNRKVLVAMESLDLTEFDRGKTSNRRDSSWIRGKLIGKLQEKLDWKGIAFKEVDPAYTSKACPVCHHIDDRNRNGKMFECTVCFHTSDADYNASVNIALRALDVELEKITQDYAYQKKKRHDRIKALYRKRHKIYLQKLSA
ncbi:transposase (plasmid) [Pontibacillus sp. ALD_SL1]|uniref:RNA-guided endonuclease InsQ/TnpB family protein n=1 Tax=Pontibacillus sp. ALD_SL1 TaxID=2777185 RepID=UPI001A962B66|nr:RNA-guided endonuclease TnpB family protein [Pontibacillus sp. ALD_SL1]QST02663.1 transposase [Pontibacillus sp. ALD_SL1]